MNLNWDDVIMNQQLTKITCLKEIKKTQFKVYSGYMYKLVTFYVNGWLSVDLFFWEGSVWLQGTWWKVGASCLKVTFA